MPKRYTFLSEKNKKRTGTKYKYSYKIKRGREYINHISHTSHVRIHKLLLYSMRKGLQTEYVFQKGGRKPMFNIFHTGEESEFSWNMIGNIADGREHLGGEMPVMMYRLLEYTIKTRLSHRYGET